MAFLGLVAVVLLLPASSKDFRWTPDTTDAQPEVAEVNEPEEVDVAEMNPRTVLRDDSWPVPPASTLPLEPSGPDASSPVSGDRIESIEDDRTEAVDEAPIQEEFEAGVPSLDLPDAGTIERVYDVVVAMATIHSDPSANSETVGVVGEGVRVTASRIEADWAFVEVDGGGSGWVELSSVSEGSTRD